MTWACTLEQRARRQFAGNHLALSISTSRANGPWSPIDWRTGEGEGEGEREGGRERESQEPRARVRVRIVKGDRVRVRGRSKERMKCDGQ